MELSHVTDYNSTHRLFRLATLLPLTRRDRIPEAFRVYIQAAVYLAFLSLPQISAPIPFAPLILLPDVAERIQNSCSNVLFELDLYDTQFSNFRAAQQVLPLLQNSLVVNNAGSGSNVTATASHNTPVAIIGAARSAVSTTLSTLTSVYGIVQISASSTASSLDDPERHPLFGRTVPNNEGEAVAMILYMQQFLPKVQHLAVLYFNDDFGSSYHTAIRRAAATYAPTLQVRSFIYRPDALEDAVISLHESGLQYIFAILDSSHYADLLTVAAQYGLAGDKVVWFFTEATIEIISPAFSVSKDNPGLANALDGTGLVLIDVPPFDPLDDALAAFVQGNYTERTPLQQNFINHFAEASIFENYTFPFFGSSFFQSLAYDAMIALALAACETPDPYPTGSVLYQQLVQTEFGGASGYVSFDPIAGTRRGDTFQFRIVNLLIDQDRSAADPFSYYFTPTTSVMALDLPNKTFELISPFVYPSGTLTPPLDLPPVVVDENLIPGGIIASGWALSVLLMASSVFWAVWTVRNANRDVVRTAQPTFLCLLCVGTFIMASSIWPMSFQEPMAQEILGPACMSVPWLLSIGFVTAFSALFSKTWRLNKLFHSSNSLRRIKITAKDVIYPFVILLSLNVLVLLAWTIVAPLRWRRQFVANFDEFGRTIESFGSCTVSDDKSPLPYLGPIYAINVVAMLFANYQAYQARRLPTAFSESGYIFLSIFTLVESSIIGAPLLFIVDDKPTTIFLIRTMLVTLWCLSIQLPCFLPKYYQNRRQQARPRQQVHVSISLPQGEPRIGIQGSLRNLFGRQNAPASVRDLGVSRVRRRDEYFEAQERKSERSSRMSGLLNWRSQSREVGEVDDQQT